MIKVCSLCHNEFSTTSTMINGKMRNLQNRTKCLKCLPFGSSLYRRKSIDDIRSAAATKAKKYYQDYKAANGIDPIASRRYERKQNVIVILGGQCQLCGYNKTQRNLAFHHAFNKVYETSSRFFQYSMQRIMAEIKKCILVCHNCHGEIHDGLVDRSIIEDLRSANERVLDGFEERPYKPSHQVRLLDARIQGDCHEQTEEMG